MASKFMDGYTPEPETKYENDYHRSYMLKKNNKQTPKERDEDMEYYVKNLINLPTNESKKNNTVTLTEAELKNIIKESVKNVLKEGTTFYDDGMAYYQGIGTPESQERTSKIRDKRGYNRFSLPYMKKAMEQNNGDLSDYNSSVYRMISKFSQDVEKLYKELLTKLEKVDLDDEVRKEMDNLTYGSRFLAIRLLNQGLLKRDIAGEPNPYYKEK
jgi:hypothetical protein